MAEVHTPKLELRSEKNQNEVREILKMGSIKAKEAAMPMIEKIRRVTGIKY
ncbi:MAG: hypothetical protein Q7S59_02180 [Sulfurimonas sp.]|nr:hypothetical protein [Sulfurimonas sp.]